MSKPGFLINFVSKVPPDFGRTRPDVHYWLFSPLLAAQVIWVAHRGRVSALEALLLIAAGIFFWTFLEYVLHRFSFHAKSEHPLVRPFNSSLHLLHHKSPASLLYVAAPIVLSAPVYALEVGLFRLLSGSWDRALVMGSSVIVSFLFYEYVHFTAHQHNPRNRVLKHLKKHHMLHHFGDSQRYFGVTSPFWDHVFGTYKRSAAPRANQPPVDQDHSDQAAS